MFLLRRVTGNSMFPALEDGRIIIAARHPRRVRVGDTVIIRHEGREKMKRIRAIHGDRVYVVGDNPAYSTDSRDFGWLDRSAVIGRTIWPRI
jgi:phage repressor protein C with HTH and peptisase S24 domain